MSGATKKHPILSNDELFYDPKEDDKDQRWVDDQRKMYRSQLAKQPTGDASMTSKPESSPKKKKQGAAPTTDAVLNCPACMTTVCLDCQRY